MTKKLLLIVVLVLSLICVLSSCVESTNNSGTSNTPENSTHTHSYGEWIPLKAATCTSNGTMAKYCSCGDKITETIQSTGHSYGEWIVTKAATCTASGTKAKQCSCGDKITETIQSTGHNWVDATCTEDKHCKNCAQSYSGTATGHKIKNGECVYCGTPGASVEWGSGDMKWVEYYYLYNDGGYTWKGGGYIFPDYGEDWASFYKDGYLHFELWGERDGNLIFDYQLKDSYGRVVKSGHITVGYVNKGETYLFDFYIGKLNPGEYTFTVSSKNALD